MRRTRRRFVRRSRGRHVFKRKRFGRRRMHIRTRFRRTKKFWGRGRSRAIATGARPVYSNNRNISFKCNIQRTQIFEGSNTAINSAVRTYFTPGWLDNPSSFGPGVVGSSLGDFIDHRHANLVYEMFQDMEVSRFQNTVAKCGLRLNSVSIHATAQVGQQVVWPDATAMRLTSVVVPTAVEAFWGPNASMDTWGFVNPADQAQLNYGQMTRWVKAHPDKNGLFHFNIRWKPKGRWDDHIMNWVSFPPTGAALRGRMNPYHFFVFAHSGQTGISNNTLGADNNFTNFYNASHNHSANQKKENVIQLPWLQVTIPPVPGGLGTGAHIDTNVTFTFNIETSWTIVGMAAGEQTNHLLRSDPTAQYVCSTPVCIPPVTLPPMRETDV